MGKKFATINGLLISFPPFARLLAFGLTLFASNVSRSQSVAELPPIDSEYVVQPFDAGSGLSALSVTAFAQTPDGYLWMGTYQNLVRFDGMRFVPFNPPGSPLVADGFLSLCTDSQGGLWAGGLKGIGRLSGNKWEAFTTNNAGYPGGTIRSIVPVGPNRIVAGGGPRLIEFDGERFKSLPAPDFPEAPGALLNCAVTTKGVVWAFCLNYLAWYAEGKWNTVLTPKDLSGVTLTGIAPSRNGGLWVSDGSRIREFRNGSWVREIARPQDFTGDALTLLEDSAFNLWAGSYTDGVLLFKPSGAILRCTMNEGLANNATLGVYEDNEKNIWTGWIASGPELTGESGGWPRTR